MNIYSLHSDPASLNHHGQYMGPEMEWMFFWHKYADGKITKQDFIDNEKIWLRHPDTAYKYCYHILQKPYDKAEKIIATDSLTGVWYVTRFKKKKLPELEKLILREKNAERAYFYSINTDTRFKEAEPLMAKSGWEHAYCMHFKDELVVPRYYYIHNLK